MVWKNVAKLAKGTGIAQIIGLATLPILTAIYNAEQLGNLALFAATTQIMASISCGRIELSIPLAVSKRDAARKLLTSIIICTVFSIILLGVLSILEIVNLKTPITPNTTQSIAIPFAVWISGVYLATQYHLNYSKDFLRISKNRVLQAASLSSAQILLGLISATSSNLVIAQTLQFSAGIAGNIRRAKLTQNLSLIRAYRTTIIVLKNTKKYWTYGILEAGINSASLHITTILIYNYIDAVTAGLFFLTTKILGAPMTLLGTSIGQVYLSEIGQYQNNSEKIKMLTKSVLAKLFIIGIASISIVAVLMNMLAKMHPNKEWEGISNIILITYPWFLLQFMSSPISMIMNLRGLQGTMLLLSTAGLILKIAATLILNLLETNIIIGLSAVNSIFYGTCLYFFYRATSFNQIEKSN